MSEARFKCPHCSQVFVGASEDAGVEAECPSCGKTFVLKPMGIALTKRLTGFQCYLGIFSNYFGFRGRAPRRNFWWAFFFWWMTYLLALILDFAIWDSPNWLSGMVGLGSTIPLVAIQVRRLHDTGKSGWWLPLILLPPINLAYFVWLATAGDKGHNRFGPDPMETP